MRREAVCLFLVLGGCTGAIEPSSNEREGQGGRPGTGGSGPSALTCTTSKTVQPGAAPLRRLTKAEYNNTVADLLGDTSAPANAFPPESRVHGFDNHVSTQTVTYTLADYFFKAAEGLASRATTKLASLYDCNPAQKTESVCAQEFIRTFGLRAYRRPLTDDEQASLLGTYQKGRMTEDFTNGVKLVMTRMLVSPHFLYRPELGDLDMGNGKSVMPLTPYEVASRLSYLFWGTMPDQALFDAAAKGELKTTAQVSAQATRLLSDARAKVAIGRFYAGWLMLDRLASSAKDEKLFPGYGAVVPAMVEEITRTMDDIIWSDDSALSRVLTSDYTFANRDLAMFVGLDGAANMGKEFSRVSLSPQGQPGSGQRMGVLSSPGLLAAHSKPQETSPVLRGRFVLEQMLCLELQLPPAGVPPIEAVDTSSLTTRERFEKHAESACASCHKFLDPIGFAFENFDAAGRFRETEKGKPIKTAGALTETDVDGPFHNAVELTQRLAKSETVRQCIATQWFRYAFGRDETGDSEHAAQQLACATRGDKANFRTLLGAVTQTDAFLNKQVNQGGKP